MSKEESKNIINLRACRSIKEMALTAHETIVELETALYDILDVNSIEAAKELAADVLDEDLEIYFEEEGTDYLDESLMWEPSDDED